MERILFFLWDAMLLLLFCEDEFVRRALDVGPPGRPLAELLGGHREGVVKRRALLTERRQLPRPAREGERVWHLLRESCPE